MKKHYFNLLIFLLMLNFNLPAQAQNTDNPFFNEWETPFQTPPFYEIKKEHFLPAFEEGIKQQNAEFEAIFNNSDEPTFENTITAIEKSGQPHQGCNR